MKANRNVNYKARLWVNEEGELHGLSYVNQQIPMDLLDALNRAMHDVVDSFNGKTAWKETYIKFTDNGKRYEQYDGKHQNTPCDDCVFSSGLYCQHPHYHDGTKGYCGKPYREQQL